jgi:hypothetical protein
VEGDWLFPGLFEREGVDGPVGGLRLRIGVGVVLVHAVKMRVEVFLLRARQDLFSSYMETRAQFRLAAHQLKPAAAPNDGDWPLHRMRR